MTRTFAAGSAAMVAAASLMATAQAQYYSATYTPSASGLPKTSEQGQSGTNRCGTGSSPTSMCQDFYINDITDWCVWGPPNGGEVADNERVEVAYCTKSGRGTRVIPDGTIQGAHFVKTKHYVQVTGTGDFTKIGIPADDQGGELDPHGADGNGNPIGGLVFHNGQQMHEWFSFMSGSQFCTRACFDGSRATSLCRHTYDELGCDFNAPGNYNAGVFESCDGQDAKDIMYGYPGLNTFQQADTSYGVDVPSAHPAPASYNCQSTSSQALSGAVTDFGATPSSTTMASSTSTSTTTSSSSSSSTSMPSSSLSTTSSMAAITADHSASWTTVVTSTASVAAVRAGSDNAQNAAGSLANILGDRQMTIFHASLGAIALLAAFAL